jgi:hypothetical protein
MTAAASMEGDPCRCWTTSPPLPHSGHCCFGYPDPDGNVYQRGQEPPCGHWHPNVPRPAKFTDQQARAWVARRCIECLTTPARAGGYLCDGCHKTHERRTA